jgi:hypothetical protein
MMTIDDGGRRGVRPMMTSPKIAKFLDDFQEFPVIFKR